MRFSGSLGAKLNQVIVALAERDQTNQLSKLAALAEHFRVEADVLNEQIDPLICSEFFASFKVSFKIKVRELNWLQGR